MVQSLFELFVDQQMAWFTVQQQTWQRFLGFPRLVETTCERRVGAPPHDAMEVPSDLDRRPALADAVCGFREDIVDFTHCGHRRADPKLSGYCVTGTVAALFAVLYSHQITNLSLLAAPIDLASRDLPLYPWTERRYFDVVIHAQGNYPMSVAAVLYHGSEADPE